ncbi:hypothetical protein FGG52_gp58 [Mycobacterium phage Backyardigan]|uniref:Uncharacterized protein n=1 Tax=Mycobacterium phage Backyardigan TaxID=2902881 RepID=G1BL31_9CAUD|nr:hypothetical protein WILE_60 [Mycobacterium phage Wile]YP_009635471.1 hypothetical protein FGG52_gp58 [Mycobacterium phage Backyardigan]AOT27566.1 hypothetical protein SEA_BADGER_59 [Mycobacterium phage Badger]ASZ73693.1 hypothetical protein SEA_MORPHER26_60 [Mycobacterium phage Morpher26]AZS11672.1 hypothetical protein SEA_CICI_60 [Mycobacterium phage Cici]QAY05389.1 hypothetical protein SEA_KATALIE136_60 [Mycobacterium phage Katalie136]QAY06967.1 hypothetical protein SEA_DATWAY_60 [Mycob
MPKPTPKRNLVHQQLLSGLIETKPVSWARKTLAKDNNGKEIVVKTTQTRQGLRFPLAQNVSNFNVDLAARRWTP